MYRILCCRSRETSKEEVDEITDSLEKCLSVDRGAAVFNSFLTSKNFLAEKATLAFAQKCQSILTDLSRLSLHTRKTQIPEEIQNDITNLCNMVDVNDINFDLDQMDTLTRLRSPDTTTDEKMNILQQARSWAIILLQPAYNTFRREALRRV